MRFVRSNAMLEAAGPVLFGGAFLAPLIAELLEATSLPVPFGLEPIYFGLVLGLTLGVSAAMRGRWV